MDGGESESVETSEMGGGVGGGAAGALGEPEAPADVDVEAVESPAAELRLVEKRVRRQVWVSI